MQKGKRGYSFSLSYSESLSRRAAELAEKILQILSHIEYSPSAPSPQRLCASILWTAKFSNKNGITKKNEKKIGSPVKSCVSNKTKPLKPFCSGRDDVSDAVSAGLVL